MINAELDHIELSPNNTPVNREVIYGEKNTDC